VCERERVGWGGVRRSSDYNRDGHSGCVCERETVWVRERERHCVDERERGRVCMRVCEREKNRKRERERECASLFAQYSCDGRSGCV